MFKKEGHLSSKFLNGLSEQAKGRSAWFYAFLALMFYQFFVINKIETALQNGEKILVPYGVAASGSEIQYSSDYSSGTDYIKLIAQADAILWGNTTPDSAVKQKQKFLKRMHPGLVITAKEDLLKTANSDKLREVTRSYEVLETFTDKKGRIRVDGVLSMDVAGVEVPAKGVSIIVSYKKGATGYPYISGWEKVETRKIGL